MAEYIDKNKLENFAMNCVGGEVSLRQIHDFPAADVVDRDEGIKMGAELAAMHGSDATSQELEKAYLDGVEEGLRKAQKTGKWVGKPLAGFCTVRCSVCNDAFCDNNGRWKFCPTCGAMMEES